VNGTRDYRHELHKQLGFIERSMRDFDAGQREEAVRIATAVRVIVHNTANSTSLLAHLGRSDIQFLTSCPYDIDKEERTTGFETLYSSGLGVLTLGEHGVSFAATVDGSPSLHYLPVLSWWGQVVWVPKPGMKIRRRDIILTAANKDGGAHVDAELPPAYVALIEQPFEPIRLEAGGPQRPEDVHLHAIRVIGEEVLRSQSLREL
jgi:hypothetical protein